MTIIGIYRGRTLSDASLVACTADPRIVRQVADHLLQTSRVCGDPAVAAVQIGKRKALRVIREEVREGGRP